MCYFSLQKSYGHTSKSIYFLCSHFALAFTVEPRLNEVAGDRPNSFAKPRVDYIEFLFFTYFTITEAKNTVLLISRFSLNRGLLNRGSTVFVKTKM